MNMEQTEYSKTLAYKIQTPGNYPEENIQHWQGTDYKLSEDDTIGSKHVEV